MLHLPFQKYLFLNTGAKLEIVRDSNSANCFSELNISPLGRTPTGIACLRAQTSKLEKKEFESTTHFLRFTWIYSFLFLSHYFISLSEKKALFQYQDHFRERYCYNVLYFSTKSFSLISYDPLIDLEVVPSRRPSCSVVGSHRLAYKTVAIFWVSLQKGALQWHRLLCSTKDFIVIITNLLKILLSIIFYTPNSNSTQVSPQVI